MVEGRGAQPHLQGGGDIADIAIITGPQIDAAEQLRSASKVKLPQEIALNGDPDVLLPILDFYSLFGLDDHPVIQDLLQSLKDHASVRLINVKAKYVDQLAHLRGERKTFHMDLTTGLPANIPSVPDGSEPRHRRIELPKPPCTIGSKDEQMPDPPFRYVPITDEKERINRGPALSVRRVGAASDGREGAGTDQEGTA